jgi:hypothetical protein
MTYCIDQVLWMSEVALFDGLGGAAGFIRMTSARVLSEQPSLKRAGQRQSL